MISCILNSGNVTHEQTCEKFHKQLNSCRKASLFFYVNWDLFCPVGTYKDRDSRIGGNLHGSQRESCK